MSNLKLYLTEDEVIRCRALLRETRRALETGPEFRGRWALQNLTQVLETITGSDGP